MKLLVLRGLPASGKSTLAKKIVTEDKSYIRVNKDDLRNMLNAGEFRKEHFICKVRDFTIIEALSKGMNVVVDDTNFHPKHLKRFVEIAAECEAEMVIQDMDTPLEECVRRDKLREKSVGYMVIKGMYNKYLKED